MKNNVITFTYGIFIIVCILVIAILIVVMTDTADAKSIDQREWLLEYEQVSGYPAPAVEPTAIYASGYPAPALEPTAKPAKKKPNPISKLTPVLTLVPTQAPTWSPYWPCLGNPDLDCPPDTPITAVPTQESKPTPAPTMNPYDGSGYPAPTVEPTDAPQDQLRLCWRLGWTQDYGFYFVVPCEEGEIP
jgi:hypothetical protein